MKHRGFGLIDAIFGIFIIGLIAVAILPIFSNSFLQYSRINKQTEMIFLGESIYERLCSRDDYCQDLLDELIAIDEVVFDDLSDQYLDKYQSTIVKVDEYEAYLDISIIISSKSDGGNISDVEFQGSIFK